MQDFQDWLNEYAPTVARGTYGNVAQTGAVTNRMNMLGKTMAQQNTMNFRKKVNMILRSLSAIPFTGQDEMMKALWRAYIVVRSGGMQDNSQEDQNSS